ncbi:MAG: LPS export ABC transporter permease LptF [Terriglobales bacterium]|jgi:LPS export ABC transporter permease LptF/LPS export ABC transporter permease LptG
MRILTRYILSEVLSHALIGVAIFTFVIFLRDLEHILEVVVRNSAPLPSVAEIFFLTMPGALTITIPMAVLVGILIGLSRLAADSEVTAMRASGIGPGTFVRTIAIFVSIAWVLALANNVFIAPRSASALARLQNRLKSSQVSFEIQPRVFYEDFKNLVLYVQDASSAEGAALWKGVFVADISNPSAPKITLAQSGIAVSEGMDKLRMHLENGSQHETVPRQPEQYAISTFAETDLPIQLPEVQTPANTVTPAAEMSTSDLLQRMRENGPRSRVYAIEFHRRLALPTACIVLALVGIPLGLSAKKGGKSTGFVLTIGLVFLYYFLSLAGMSMARQGKIAAGPGLWLGNIVFFFGGLFLLWRSERMPIDIFSLRHWWAELASRFKARVPAVRGAGDAFERAANRKRMFSARFPLLIDDYILRDFFVYLGMILSTFLMLMLVFTFFELLGDIVRNRVPLVMVGQYLINVTPYFIYNTTHISVLLAVLVTFGLMQKANEITAMKATGISIYRVILPVMVIAAILATGLFFFEQLYLPHANKRQDALRNQIKGKPAQTYLRPDRKWIFGQRSDIYYYEFFDAESNRFGSISIFEFDPKTFELRKRIYATRAHWSDTLQKWVFEQGWERTFRGSAIEAYHPFDVETFAELREPPGYFKKEVKQSSEMNYDELNNYIHDLQQSGFDVVRLRVQLQKKFAFPIITFVMAMLAVPFALTAGRRGALAGVATAVGIAVVYFIVSGLFEAMGNTNQLPPALAAWSPDLLFALAGGYMILKVPT